LDNVETDVGDTTDATQSLFCCAPSCQMLLWQSFGSILDGFLVTQTTGQSKAEVSGHLQKEGQ
jgi:hypothetical protein